MTESDGTIFHKYMEEFAPFFRKIAWVMTDNHRVKGNSWKKMSWVQLMDNLSKQYEDMENDPGREDYYANIACYAGMLWLQEQSQDSTQTEAEQ